MATTLGLDLGTNSIGWALIDDANHKIIDAGVRIFPEGVNRDTKGAEVSKNAARRTSRQMRRMYLRKKYRKTALIKFLIQHQLFPDIEQIFASYATRKAPKNFREKLFFVLNQVQLHPELRNFFALNPYQLRHEAIRGRALSKLELGRTLLHFAQRRGYRESLQAPLEDGKTLLQGKVEEGTLGIEATKQAIAQYGSLGSALYQLQLAHEQFIKDKTAAYPPRVRNRYTLRSMYKQEFEAIWAAQQPHHPQVLTPENLNLLASDKYGLVFMQRPLRNQRFLLGSCTFEPGKRKAHASSLLFEEYRMYDLLNKILLDGQRLSDEHREAIKQLFYSKEQFSFADIKKKLGLQKNQFNYADDQKIVGNKTHIGLAKVFGKARWSAMDDAERNHAWQIKINAENPEKTTTYLKNRWQLDDKQVASFLKLRLDKDYASLSTLAIRRILPYLKKGKLYNEAVILAGLQKAFGADRWGKMSAAEKQQIEDTVEGLMATTAGTTQMQQIKQFLADAYQLSPAQLNKLYHHSQLQAAITTGQFPKDDKEIQKVRNPVVMATLFELRKLVTAIIQQHGHPDEIRVEMARELKVGKNKRDEIRLQQYANERANDEAKKILDEYQQPHTRTNIRKVLLYKEIEKVAGSAINPYNPSQTFSIERLFNDGYVQIEHIVPYSISLDDSMANLTLCDADTNRAKGDQTPAQFFGNDPAAWEAHKKQIFKILPYQKAKRFVDEKAHELDSFIQRQLNDTRYIARFAKEYLRYVCDKVTISQGAATSKLRQLWGLNSLLSSVYEVPASLQGEYAIAVDADNTPVQNAIHQWQWSEGDKINKKAEEELRKKGRVLWGYAENGRFYPGKTRDDHRHHAIDALVIACTRTSFLQQMSYLNARGRYEDLVNQEARFPLPWQHFFQDCKKLMDEILISYKKQQKVLTKSKKALYESSSAKPLIKAGKRIYGTGLSARGPLHEASLYGKHRLPNDPEFGYHKRERLDKLTAPQIRKIADKAVQAAVLEAIRRINPQADLADKNFVIPPGAFFEKTADGKLLPKVFLPNKNGSPMPVMKVRIRENKSNAVQLKDYNVWVAPGNNHEVIIYETPDGQRKGKVISFWEAAEALKQGIKTSPEIDGKLVMRLQKGDMVLLDVNEHLTDAELPTGKALQDRLYYVRKFSSSGNNITMVFMKHTASGLDANLDRLRAEVQAKSPSTFKGIKVELSITGKLKRI